MKAIKTLVQVSVLALALQHTTQAAANTSIAIVAVPSLTNVDVDIENGLEGQGVSSEREFGMGGGILFDIPVSEAVSFGTGAIYNSRTFQIHSLGTEVERKIPTIFVPAEAKFWIIDAVGIGAGGFAAMRVGDVTNTIKAGDNRTSVTSSTDRESIEYGLTASANVLVPVDPSANILLGARYLYGLTNASRVGSYTENIQDLQFMAGVSFSLF